MARKRGGPKKATPTYLVHREEIESSLKRM